MAVVNRHHAVGGGGCCCIIIMISEYHKNVNLNSRRIQVPVINDIAREVCLQSGQLVYTVVVDVVVVPSHVVSTLFVNSRLSTGSLAQRLKTGVLGKAL